MSVWRIQDAFAQRVAHLPRLGLGVSTEYGAHQRPAALDVFRLRREYPEFGGFLELGVEANKGFDDAAARWIKSQAPTTYHFLDINLSDPADRQSDWLQTLSKMVERSGAAWVCGDSGWWHFGARESGHMLLLPPILSRSAVAPLAEGVIRVREALGKEVLPENPPGHWYLGDLHLLDYYAEVVEAADCGMLLDCAHLAIYQAQKGHSPLTGFDGFPWERIVELHVAGGEERRMGEFVYIEDTHTPEVLADTWQIYQEVVRRSPNLKAVVYECERNPLEVCLPGFRKIAAEWGAA